jgi:hypothetical protein
MPSTALIGISGVHYVAAELSRRGMIALPTIRNTAAYDLVVVTPDGTKHANIQVKTSFRRVSNFPMPPVEKIRTGRHDFYVLVRWIEKNHRFEAFMLSGPQARNAVDKRIKVQKGNIRKGTRKSVWPGIRADASDPHQGGAWRKKWESWKL